MTEPTPFLTHGVRALGRDGIPCATLGAIVVDSAGVQFGVTTIAATQRLGTSPRSDVFPAAAGAVRSILSELSVTSIADLDLVQSQSAADLLTWDGVRTHPALPGRRVRLLRQGQPLMTGVVVSVNLSIRLGGAGGHVVTEAIEIKIEAETGDGLRAGDAGAIALDDSDHAIAVLVAQIDGRAIAAPAEAMQKALAACKLSPFQSVRAPDLADVPPDQLGKALEEQLSFVAAALKLENRELERRKSFDIKVTAGATDG